MYTFAFAACLLFFGFTAHAQVVINEFSASNLEGFLDNYNKTEDWIELYNTSSSTVDVSGWHLTDRPSKPTKWAIPAGTTIAGNGFLRFWCSGRDEAIGSDFHTSFKLTQTAGKDSVVFADPAGVIQEEHALDLTMVEHSRCRETDGAATWRVCTNPTPNSSNDGTPQVDGYTEQPTITLPAGFYPIAVTVQIQSNEPNSEIRYTTDGTNPTTSSPLYSGPITISSNSVLKGQVFSNNPDILPGKMAYNSYFINETITMPVFSVAADEVQNLANGDGDLIPIGTIEYFDVGGVRRAESFGSLNRHGQDSWILPHRSLDWVSRDEMGYNKAVDTKLFNYSDRTEFQRFMLRASGDDNYPANNDQDHEGSAHVRDEYVQTLAQEGNMKLDLRALERVVVFLNGDYWGVYGLRERPADHDYTKEYYDQGKYDLNYLTTWGNTEAEYGGQRAFDAWEEFRDFILNNDMSVEANYQFVKDNLQVTGLCDYMIINLAVVSSDWMNYNTGWWEGLDPDGDHKKWGYILWDNDATFDYYINYSGVPNTNPDAEPCDIDDISDYMDQFFGPPFNAPDVGLHEKIFLKLQDENDEFRQLYYSRQADMINTTFSCDNMLSTLDSLIDIIEPEMPRQIARWGGSMNEWQTNVGTLRNFVEQRCQNMHDGMIDCFALTGPYEVTLLTYPDDIGEIDFNTLDIEQFPWTGEYYGNMEQVFTARSFDPNWSFSHWATANGTVVSAWGTDGGGRMELTGNETLTAVFEPTSVAEHAVDFSVAAYPTATRDVLTVAYELDHSAPVTATVHSLLGTQVASISPMNRKHSEGAYQHQLNVRSLDLAAGPYLLKFQAGTETHTLRFFVVE